ncbi:conserved hypothetical protein [Trichormus variabilis ATCC 29413]|uniref:DUF2808 domain-containing protein n=2 Tax=Anabaena variabilis TaxID=264691 RepID=Q3MFJ8_TRIV2|nr:MULTISPECIES: DUF2808 domain-containing protein [Nostocaceae]ABA20238.1 conserved hypothetical protein [Trichormus variabilis ATCC 29413]MBC1215092.1 DUF2808 domain-containing protein [Trichormus variabilis ARAD]MBC1258847.1 DUF2808 domain-containing protein [Trichormus variabilis V5]MBC1270361.1 DUF2808 domain-containing protein [Trichormus variabilis FSR]MBC1303370.1 DUF2808 domain-containing protein [Trichormus variabilis N2B]
MKSLIYGSLSALILSTSAVAIATPVKHEQSGSNINKLSQVALNVNVPHITNSGVRNGNHFIRLAVVGMSLQDLMISLPSQMERFNGVRIRDESGKAISAKTEISKENLSITFDEPVTSGASVEVELTGVRRNSLGQDVLLYGVTARRVGLTGDIPVGTARIDIYDKN